MHSTLNASSLGHHRLDTLETEQVTRPRRQRPDDHVTSGDVELCRRAAERERHTLILLRQAQRRRNRSSSLLTCFNRHATFLLWCRSAPESARPTIILSPVIVAVVLVVVGVGLRLAPSVADVLALCTGVLGLTLNAHLFLFPSRRWLVSFTERLTGRQEALRSHLAELASRYRSAERRCRDAQKTYSRLHRILASPRRRLLAAGWRDMRGVEFEQFVGSVFAMLEYEVEFTRATGDEGADLFLSKEGQRGVVQVKGWQNNVGSKAVQEAYYAQGRFQCDWCAVVINSRFTASAIRGANEVDCWLIDVDELDALIGRAARL